MERKIGEIFEYKGEWYQCIIGHCNQCSFDEAGTCKFIGNPHCAYRNDKKLVCFKKLEKVREPYVGNNGTFQSYKLAMPIYGDIPDQITGFTTTEVVIKQNKEDMEEKKDNYDGNMDKECIQICDALNSISDVHTTESCCGHCKNRFMVFFTCDNPHSLAIIARVFDRRYISTSQPWYIELQTKDSGAYDYFIHSETKYDSEEVMMNDINQIIENIKYWCDDKFASHFKGCDDKPTLAPFDINLAKQGKPVCTRDGRKARIVCFDRRLFYKNVSYPILALVEGSDGEDYVCGYNEKGKVLIEDGAEYKDDLMMLPEKKVGWINVYKGGKLDADYIFPTKADAVENIFQPMKDNYIDTIKVNWSE